MCVTVCICWWVHVLTSDITPDAVVRYSNAVRTTHVGGREGIDGLRVWSVHVCAQFRSVALNVVGTTLPPPHCRIGCEMQTDRV